MFIYTLPSSYVRNGKSSRWNFSASFFFIELALVNVSRGPGAAMLVRRTTFWISITFFTLAWARMLHQAKLRTGRPLLQPPISYCSHSAPGIKRFICFSYFQRPINLIVIISCHWSCLEEEMPGERDWGLQLHVLFSERTSNLLEKTTNGFRGCHDGGRVWQVWAWARVAEREREKRDHTRVWTRFRIVRAGLPSQMLRDFHWQAGGGDGSRAWPH